MNILESKTNALKNFCETMVKNCSAVAFNLCDTDKQKSFEYQCKANAYKKVLNYLKELEDENM